MTPDEQELMERICKQIAVEKDPNKFTELCHELNELLEKKEHRLKPSQRQNHGPRDPFRCRCGEGTPRRRPRLCPRLVSNLPSPSCQPCSSNQRSCARSIALTSSSLSTDGKSNVKA